MRFRNTGMALGFAAATIGCTDGEAAALVTGAELTQAGASGERAAAGGGAGRGYLPQKPMAGRGSSTSGGGANGADNAGQCPASNEERQLLDALNEAIDSDRYCLERPLSDDNNLRCTARDTAQFLSSMGMAGGRGREIGWIPGDRVGGSWWWLSLHADSLMDAEEALLQADAQDLCAAGRSTPYTSAAVGHVGESWLVIIQNDS